MIYGVKKIRKPEQEEGKTPQLSPSIGSWLLAGFLHYSMQWSKVMSVNPLLLLVHS